jgi:hypothetical protein
MADEILLGITVIERDAVLAGLRLLQEALERDDLSPLVRDIYTNGEDHDGLTIDQINTLCEDLDV